MDFVGVSHSKLDLEDISSKVSSVGCNEVLLFVGINTENYNTEDCDSVEYETNIQCAEKVFRGICVKARERWTVQNIAIYHRLGSVPIRDASVVISISSPDACESMQAFQYIIKKVKEMSLVIKKNVVKVQVDGNCFVEESMQNNLVNESKLKTDSQHISDAVQSHLIQIKADTKEINRRINCFIERKRQQLNVGNIHDFFRCSESSKSETSCARTDAVVIRRKDSKSHLRIRRVYNTWGPQTRQGDHLDQDGQCTNGETKPKQSQELKPDNSKPSGLNKLTGLAGIEERLENAEEHLHICDPVPQDIYERLKRIENRILYLESVSPEYFQCFGNHRAMGKQAYSQTDLNKKLKELEFKFMR